MCNYTQENVLKVSPVKGTEHLNEPFFLVLFQTLGNETLGAIQCIPSDSYTYTLHTCHTHSSLQAHEWNNTMYRVDVDTVWGIAEYSKVQ